MGLDKGVVKIDNMSFPVVAETECHQCTNSRPLNDQRTCAESCQPHRCVPSGCEVHQTGNISYEKSKEQEEDDAYSRSGGPFPSNAWSCSISLRAAAMKPSRLESRRAWLYVRMSGLLVASLASETVSNSSHKF